MFLLRRLKRRALRKCFFSAVSNAGLPANVFSSPFQTLGSQQMFCLQRLKRGFKSNFRGIFAPRANLPAKVLPPPFETLACRHLLSLARKNQERPWLCVDGRNNLEPNKNICAISAGK
jgi:hypothetical protein